jgi:hypothetical protein
VSCGYERDLEMFQEMEAWRHKSTARTLHELERDLVCEREAGIFSRARLREAVAEIDYLRARVNVAEAGAIATATAANKCTAELERRLRVANAEIDRLRARNATPDLTPGDAAGLGMGWF